MIVADATRRVAVIGDVGGHVAELRAELTRLGVPDGGAGPLPDDLTVVQVGDLVHRGPDSEAVVALVDTHLRRQPQRWVQLVGNHEALYLRDPAFQWPERIATYAADLIRDWWAAGLMRVAVALRNGEEDLLVTHAGLTAGYWSRVLGSPARAVDAARQLNGLGEAGHDDLFRAGAMLGSGPPQPLAGPLWAEPARELLGGWLDRTLPFSQIHGHASWSTQARPGRPGSLDTRIAATTVVDTDAGHEITRLVGGRVLGVDPGHGRLPCTRWSAWVFPERRKGG